VSENVENKFKEWKARYKFEDFYDFNVKSLLQLQEQFEQCDPEHVRTKKDLLDMILRLQGNLPRLFVYFDC
jgi:hypothetical protein